jgi:type IV pilus assembly protein PilB
MQLNKEQFKAFLLDSNLVTEKELKQALKKTKGTKRKLGDELVKSGIVDETRLAKVYAYLLGIPFVSLEKMKIQPDTLKIIPEAIARAHNIVAFNQTDKDIEVAMLDPKDLQTIESIKKKTGLEVLPRLTSKESIQLVLKQYQKTLEGELKDLAKRVDEKILTVADDDKGTEKIKGSAELEKIAKGLPIVKIVDTILKHAILEGASDIHIEPLEREIDVRYRIDGILKSAMVLPKSTLTGIIARIKVMSNLKLDEHRLPQDGRFKIEAKDYKISFRVSILPIMDGEKAVMRLLPEQSDGLTLEQLGLQGEALEKVHRAINRPHGMILATGPTGSGKTTTLYTCLDILNKPSVNITTIEDPIEYRLEHINQTQVRPKIGFDFANGLRSIVRQDPDIIMVGEIRDKETAGIAVNSALTGHLLLSTLHTNDAATSVPRLRDLGIEPFLIASTLNVVIGQRLVRKISSITRKEKYSLDKKQIEQLRKEFDLDRILEVLKQEGAVDQKADWNTIEFQRPKITGGDKEKGDDGYKGRIGIYEVLEVEGEIQSLITHQGTSKEIHKEAVRAGMVTLAQDGFLKAVQGLTTLDEILRVTRE